MSDNKNILITGASGQLGYELQRTSPQNYQITPCDVDTLDITNLEQVENYISSNAYDVIINGAAYTAVDKAEDDKEIAWNVNHQGAENLAKVATKNNILLIQISTDFVFDGTQSSPYLAEDYFGNSESVYGASKLAGEKSVLAFAPENSLIIRTSWLYSAHGNNFVKSMINLMNSRDALGIVSDQIGTPTWAKTLANTIWSLETTSAKGIYHCSDNGVASWYDFAVVIQHIAIEKGLIEKPIEIRAIKTTDYPTPAARPAYSVMDKTKTEKKLDAILPHWQTSLDNMLEELSKAS